MRKLSTFSMILTVLAVLAAAAVWAAEETKPQEKAKPQYVGVKKCKPCHLNVYKSWLETKLPKAFDVLSDEEKKNAECVGCHITGKTADGTVLEGIQCEACHGPGSMYKSIKIMNKKKWKADPETYQKKAIEAGLIYPPTEENCMCCHKKEGNPNFKEFVFAKSKPLVHVMKSVSASTKKAAKPADSTSSKK